MTRPPIATIHRAIPIARAAIPAPGSAMPVFVAHPAFPVA